MAEIVSRQAAKVAAGTKLSPGETNGKLRMQVITTPATHAAAIGDTIGTGVPLPIGARFYASTRIAMGTGAASSTIDIGIRDWVTKAVIDEDLLVAGQSLTTATVTTASTGAAFLLGAEYLTTQVAEVYATFKAATPTANQQIRIEIPFVSPD